AILSRIGSAVGFAEGVAASNQRNSLLIIHSHAAECFPYVPGCREWIRVTVWPLRIHIDQAHLNGAERILKHPVAGVTLICEPLPLGSPVKVRGCPQPVLTPACEAERLQSHRLQGTVAGEDHQIGP